MKPTPPQDGRRGLVPSSLRHLIQAALFLFSILHHPPSAKATTFSPGDIFVAQQSGNVQWRNASGGPIATIATGDFGQQAGMRHHPTAGDLWITNFNAYGGPNSVRVVNTLGTPVGAFDISSDQTHPESVVFDASGNAYVGGPDGKLVMLSASGTPLATFTVPTDHNPGPDWIDLASDQKTIYYTSEGTIIKRFDVSTGTSLTDFADLTAIIPPVPLSPHRLYALRLLPSGGLLVVAANAVYRLDTSGNVTGTYSATGEDSLFSLALTPDCQSFWTGSIGGGPVYGHVYKFDLACSTALSPNCSTPVQSFAAGQPVGGLAIFGDNCGRALSTEVCGIKFNDLNGNGMYEPQLGELGLAGWTINLAFGTPPNVINLQTTTDANGNYCFTGLAPGTYTVFETLLPGWTQTFPAPPGTYTVTVPPSLGNINFGNKVAPTPTVTPTRTPTSTPTLSGGGCALAPPTPGSALMCTGVCPAGQTCCLVNVDVCTCLSDCPSSTPTPTPTCGEPHSVIISTGSQVWELVAAPTPVPLGPAVVVPLFDSWFNLSPASWISPSAGCGTNSPGCPAGLYSYQLCWEQCGPLAFSPLLQVLADNSATVSLDGNPLTTTPATVGFTTPATILGFTPGPGVHTLQVDVVNNLLGTSDTATGMALSGILDGSVTIVECRGTPPTFTPTNTATPTPTARTGCDLAITKVPDLDPPLPGFPFVFEVTVTNVGNMPCQPTTSVTDNLLSGFTVTGFTFNTADGWGCTAPPNISCTNSTLTLQPNQSSVVFDVTVSATPGISLQNCATVANTGDVFTSNNTACYTVGITSPTSTPTSTPTVTRTPTPTRTPKFPPACVGDCDGNGDVTVDKLITMVNIALGNADVSSCIAGDASGDGMITVDEILAAVTNALDGCPKVTATPGA